MWEVVNSFGTVYGHAKTREEALSMAATIEYTETDGDTAGYLYVQEAREAQYPPGTVPDAAGQASSTSLSVPGVKDQGRSTDRQG